MTFYPACSQTENVTDFHFTAYFYQGNTLTKYLVVDSEHIIMICLFTAKICPIKLANSKCFEPIMLIITKYFNDTPKKYIQLFVFVNKYFGESLTKS